MNNSLKTTKEIKVLLSQLRAFCNTINEILNNSSSSENGRYACYKDMASIYNDFAKKVEEVSNVSSMFYIFNINELPGWADTVWPMQKRILEQVYLSAKMLLSSLEGSIDFVDDEFDNIENFLQARLRSVVYHRPDKEVEIQNAIEALLLGRGLSKGIDYDRESGKFNFSGREYVPDFIIPKMSLCIEVKLLREGRKSSLIEEISADITAYKKQYSRLLFIVYDLGVIQNEVEFRRDIEIAEGTKVIIIKH